METKTMFSVRRNKPDSKCDQGAAMVEFALVLPVLLILLFGIIDFGFYFYNDLQLTQAARDAVRYASVNDTERAEAAIADGKSRLINVKSFEEENIYYGVSGNPEEYARVELRASYSFISPLPGLLNGFWDIGFWDKLIPDPLPINASARMMRE